MQTGGNSEGVTTMGTTNGKTTANGQAVKRVRRGISLAPPIRPNPAEVLLNGATAFLRGVDHPFERQASAANAIIGDGFDGEAAVVLLAVALAAVRDFFKVEIPATAGKVVAEALAENSQQAREIEAKLSLRAGSLVDAMAAEVRKQLESFEAQVHERLAHLRQLLPQLTDLEHRVAQVEQRLAELPAMLQRVSEQTVANIKALVESLPVPQVM